MMTGWTVVGEVVHGRRLGRELGFPTANIGVPADCTAPDGVYRSRVTVDGVQYEAMSNLGCNPSVGGGRRHLETHLFGFGGACGAEDARNGGDSRNFSSSLYGRILQVELLIKIRDERTFATVEELRRQLEQDRQTVVAMIEKEREG